MPIDRLSELTAHRPRSSALCFREPVDNGNVYDTIWNGSLDIREYTDAGGSPFAEWFNGLDPLTAARVDRYIRRLQAGNFGAAKALRAGVFELRLDFGPGYRIYYGREGRSLILLLGGGSKRRQEADIAAAVERWKRFKKT